MSLHPQIFRVAFPVLAFFGVGTPGDFVAGDFLWLFFFFAPVALAAYAIYHAFSGPLRRTERARIFLDLIEAGFRQGQRPENALARAAQTNDRSLGELFQQMAARLQKGVRLSQALEEVPKLLPPQVAATLRVGEEMGDVRKVLPACRGLLRDADSQTRNGFNYLVIANLIMLPTMPILILFLKVFVFPKFLGISDSYGQQPPAAILLVMQFGFWVAGAQLLLAFFLWCWVCFYVSGPRAYGWVRVDGRTAPPHPVLDAPLWKMTGSGLHLRLEFGPLMRTPLWSFIGRPLAPLRDRLLYALPWRRRRLQRDFCATLSLLLDAETPEPAAITLAAEATANHVFVQAARRALEDLAAGKKLQVALQRFDQAGEFSWRLANAAAQHGGFLPALSGWMEALDAKAFQQEQTASQLITTGLVLCNGMVAGLIAAGIFSALISLES
jgi:type II secretory pathway component PulF